MAAAIPSKVSKWVDVAVSFAAAIVLWGALRKITHAPDADTWLWIGLVTEAVIFALYGVLYIMYPALPDSSHSEELTVAGEVVKPAKGGAVAALDKALIDAHVSPEVLTRLGDNFKKLNETIGNMNNISDVVAVTGDYTAKTKEVTAALDKVKESYIGAANSVGAFNLATEGAKTFHDQVQVLTKNLSSLNTIYELELQESNNHLKALNGFYGKLSETSASLINSADDAKKVQEQIGSLATNLGRLNGIYGNMLTAMQGK